MMKAYIIYDENGTIQAAQYGENLTVPNNIHWLFQDIPDVALPTVVDVSDPDNHKLMYRVSKESTLEEEIKELRAQVAYLTMMSGVEMGGEINE